MGTNVYYDFDICECCKRSNTIHIGKSAAGWTFIFEGHEGEHIRSYQDWLAFFAATPGVIRTEYGDIETVDNFKAWVESKRNEPRNHAREWHNDTWLDPEGHAFIGHNFS